MKEARTELIDSVIKAAKVVTSTMGPHGHSVALLKQGFPIASRDGVYIAKEQKYENSMDQMGAKFLADAANTTVQEAGDGTTTTCAIVQGMLEAIDQGYELTPSFIESLEEMRDNVVSAIDEISQPIESKEVLEKAAIISANNNEAMGRMAAEIVWEVGADGAIYIEDAIDRVNRTEVQDGYSFDGRPIQDVRQAMSLPNVYTLLAEEKISDQNVLLPIYKEFQRLAYDGKRWTGALICIVSDIQGSAYRAARINYEKGVPVFFVKAPETGERRLEAMKDIQAITGGYLFSEYISFKLGEIEKRKVENPFGQVGSAVIEKGKTTLFFGEDRRDQVRDRVDYHATQMKEADPESSLYKFHQEAVSKLTSGVGFVYVGGDTDAEKAYNAMLWDDAIMASRSALREGSIPGLAATLYSLVQEGEASDVFNAGLTKPIEILSANSRKSVDELATGQNILTGEPLVDPAKVAKSCVKNAVSLAIQIIRTKYIQDHE